MDKKKITNMEVKRKNRNEVFRYICKRGTVSNPDISYELKMSLPTATQITKELMEQGLIEEKGELQSTGGRRAKALSAVINVKQAVGLDITKNHITLVLTNIVGEMLKYERISQPFTPDDDYYRNVSEKLELFLEESGTSGDRILGVGISIPAIIDLDRELITYSHALGLEAVSLTSLSRFFSYPCFFMNDANAGAYAEGFYYEGTEPFFYLAVGGMCLNHYH